MRIDLVYGTVTPPGRLATALRSFEKTLREDCGVAGETLDLAALPLPPAGSVWPDAMPAEVTAALEGIAAADALVVFSPVFRASAPGALKNLFDLLPVAALESKPVGTVAMGASPHHFLAVDSDLHPILAWFGAITLPAGPYLTGRSFEEGGLTAAAAGDLADYARSVAEAARRLSGLRVLPRPLAAGA